MTHLTLPIFLLGHAKRVAPRGACRFFARRHPLVCDRYHSPTTPLIDWPKDFRSSWPLVANQMAIGRRRDARSGTTEGRVALSDCRRKRSRNKPRSGSFPLVRLASGIRRLRSASLGLIGAAPAPANGRNEQIRDHSGTCLHSVARRRTIGDAKRSGTIVDPKRSNGIDASADHRRVLH
jgi:hypothetical protein